jgi:hypothetical protein
VKLGKEDKHKLAYIEFSLELVLVLSDDIIGLHDVIIDNLTQALFMLAENLPTYSDIEGVEFITFIPQFFINSKFSSIESIH